jgi:ectoine hydroxylase-related dioxygenase (phytanoyl-CoA dioxygenase family)
MLAHPTLLDIVEALIGPNIRWHHTKLNAKAPGGGRQVEWHTDWGYYPHTNSDLLEIGVALDPITERNGGLRILAGSHTGPVWDHYEGDDFVGAVAPGSFDMDATVPIDLEIGDISLHHVRALHGSAPNLSDRPRRLLLQGYAAADAWPLMANHQPADWPPWDERMLRGNPTRDARLDGSPVRIPLPLTRALGLFDTQSKMTRSHYQAQIDAASDQ